MVTLEQVKLLETKITKAIDIVKKVTDENSQLKGKLDSYQKRIDELEILIQEFKEEQSRIEDGVLSALDRLNQFEDAVETAINRDDAPAKQAAPKPAASKPVETPPAKPPVEPASKPAELPAKPPAEPAPKPAEPKPAAQAPAPPPPELIEDEMDDLEDNEDETGVDSGELDIF